MSGETVTPNERLRMMEQAWRSSGDEDARARWLRERLSQGELSTERAQLAAHLRCEGAIRALELPPPAEPIGFTERRLRVWPVPARWWEHVIAHILAAGARTLLPQWQQACPDERGPLIVLDVVDAWLRCPEGIAEAVALNKCDRLLRTLPVELPAQITGMELDGILPAGEALRTEPVVRGQPRPLAAGVFYELTRRALSICGKGAVDRLRRRKGRSPITWSKKALGRDAVAVAARCTGLAARAGGEAIGAAICTRLVDWLLEEPFVEPYQAEDEALTEVPAFLRLERLLASLDRARGRRVDPSQGWP